MGDILSDPFLVHGHKLREPETDTGSLASYARLHNGAALNSLLPSSATRPLDLLTENLPLAVTSLWGYEFSLYHKESSSDILICIHNPGAFKESLAAEAGWGRVISEPYLARMRELVANWASPGNRLGQVISNLWFEYDYEGIVSGSPTPNVFYGPKDNCHSLEKIWATQQLFDHLKPGSLPKGTFRSLARCMSWLAAGSTVTQIGQMLARGENRLRVFIQHIPSHGILPFLNRMGYLHCSNPELREQLEWCYRLADSVDLDIDLADTLGEQLGLECYFDSIEKAALFLDHLLERNLCDLEKYEKVKQHLRRLYQQNEPAFLPFFSHFKLGFHPVKGLTAKVYLGYVERGIAAQVIRTPLTTPPRL